MESEEKDGISRRDFLMSVGIAGGAAAAGPTALAGASAAMEAPHGGAAPEAEQSGLLASMRPQQNEFRNLMDLSGFWEFQLDPKGEGEQGNWKDGLPSPRVIPVPASWNDLFDDAADYLGYAWYSHEAWIPAAWRHQRIFLRIYSANYAAKVWMNGVLLGEHLGGHLPFAFEVSSHARLGAPNRIVIRVENLQQPDRVPPGNPPGRRGFFNGFPDTTYDFFPYAGLGRQVALYTCPGTHVEDITVMTEIDSRDGIVKVAAQASRGWNGKGRAVIKTDLGSGAVTADLNFTNGEAHAELRLGSARFWSPGHPNLYPLTVELLEAGKPFDSYRLEIGVRTFTISGEQLLLNGEPIKLRGFGKHEDFPLHGKGLDRAQLVRDYELLKWVGANSYRTSHYPYSEEAMELADRYGIMIIDEIPAVGLNFAESDEHVQAWTRMAGSQLRSLIARDKNHPSVVMWSVANEPGAGRPLSGQKAGQSAIAAGDRYFDQLVRLAHKLDATRPVTFAAVQGGPAEWMAHVDVVALNRYYGWYTLGGQLDLAIQALAKELDALHAAYPKPMIFTEFGAEALAGSHGTAAEMWTEEYQAETISRYLDAAAQRSFMAGTLMWCFADFKTSQSIIRTNGMNNKGVFTRDRHPKRAAHMLHERWRGEGV
ncbi:MAG: beta-glucuronidase [Acidobacteria bacterium]|nr:MAG: beta-glucuronidase [Acidobacteriota bacterium]